MTTTPTRADVVARYRLRLTPEVLAAVRLREGVGTGQEGDACLIQDERRRLREAALELGAVELARDYDPSTDACPPCTSPICRGFAIQVQDAREDWRRECEGPALDAGELDRPAVPPGWIGNVRR